MNEALQILIDVAGYTEKEAQEKFTIQETPTEWVIKAIGYLESKTWKTIVDAVTEKGGGYRKDENTRYAIFTIPKQQSEVAAEKQESIADEGQYALSKSVKGKFGQLVPCIVDAENRIVDGVHRLQINPKAWTVKREDIKTPVDHALARMTVNFCRRHYTTEEMASDVGLLIGSGYTVQQIADITGISERTVYRYMPSQLKDEKKVEAGQAKVLTAVTTNLTTSDTLPQTPALRKTQQEMAQRIIDCERCGQPMDRSRGSIVGGQIICPKCAGKTERPPVEKPETPKKLFKETGEQRVAQMHPPKSKFEVELLNEIEAEGIPLERDKEFCIQKTVPDAVIPRKTGKPIAIYIDNIATHEEGNERDEFLRSRLEKLYDVEICVVQYRANTREEREKAKEQIREMLKW
jgi:hypothetical protein